MVKGHRKLRRCDQCQTESKFSPTGHLKTCLKGRKNVPSIDFEDHAGYSIKDDKGEWEKEHHDLFEKYFYHQPKNNKKNKPGKTISRWYKKTPG